MSSYLFDVRLMTTIRVEADSADEARRKLTELLDCADVNFGAIDGEPVLGEASIFLDDNGDQYVELVEET